MNCDYNEKYMLMEHKTCTFNCLTFGPRPEHTKKLTKFSLNNSTEKM